MRVRAILRRFARAREGLAAVEFALIAPMMIMVLFTSMELINALQTNRRVENTASSLADVISRDTEITNQEMTGLWSAVAPLMAPDLAAGADLRITSISLDEDAEAEVTWSEQCRIQMNGSCGGSGFADLTDGTPIAASELPGENTPNSSLIRVEIAYEYRPIIGFFLLNEQRELSNDDNPITLRHTSYRRSRLVDPIPRIS